MPVTSSEVAGYIFLNLKIIIMITFDDLVMNFESLLSYELDILNYMIEKGYTKAKELKNGCLKYSR